MTGFGSKEAEVALFGRVRVELRSTNHKFLETVVHVPEGFLSLEDKIKKEIDSRIKRGRITCVIHIIGRQPTSVSINKPLLRNYMLALKNMQNQFHIKDGIALGTIIHLPGVLSLAEDTIPKSNIWPRLKMIVKQALEDLEKARKKEGQAMSVYLKKQAYSLAGDTAVIKAQFIKTVRERVTHCATDEERANFLKETDITEEIERLSYHIGNFTKKLSKSGAVGKELDFIAQEMQREANTMAAKSFSAAISARVVQIKSDIEKIREQIQNIE